MSNKTFNNGSQSSLITDNNSKSKYPRVSERFRPFLPLLSEKKPYDYKILEPIEVDSSILDADIRIYDLLVEAKNKVAFRIKGRELNRDISSMVTEMIGETEDYYVYSFPNRTEWGSSLVRQSKTVPDDMVYFGHKKDNTCGFAGHIFYITRGSCENYLDSVSIKDGKIFQYYSLFGKKEKWIMDVVVSQDSPESLEVRNDRLYVTVHREKGKTPYTLDGPQKEDCDPFNLTMDYAISIRCEGNNLYTTYCYPEIDTSQLHIEDGRENKNWKIATANGQFFFVNRDGKVAKWSKGYVIYTPLSDIANQIVDDLELHGENAARITNYFNRLFEGHNAEV